MNLFAKLFHDLDEMTKTNAKLDRLVEYFKEAPPEDAIWVVWFLSGNRIKGTIKTGEIRNFVAERADLPLWLVEECHHQVGDLAETAALLVRGESDRMPQGLNFTVQTFIHAMRGMDSTGRRESMNRAWDSMRSVDLLPFHKLLTGGFRMGVSKGNLYKALARVGKVEPAVISQRLAGEWTPSSLGLSEILNPESEDSGWCRPFPFCLAPPLQEKVESLGNCSDWQVEWKWDGIRAQLIKASGRGILWSRGDESVGDAFPEILDCIKLLPDDICLDGEILAWGSEGLRSFSRLQKRLGRKDPGPSILKRDPVRFLAYDLLRCNGKDCRDMSLEYRREKLEAVVNSLPDGFPLDISPLVNGGNWKELESLREESRARGVEGFMLKRKDSAYRGGRVKGSWFKWKVDPFLADMVVVSAQLGHGKRSNLFTDYSLAVWNESGELVTVAKAYSGLTDKEIEKVDRFVRKNVTGKFGPVRGVRPELVFEIAFEGVQASGRHKSGVALRFPRIHRWRSDKKPEDADTLEMIRGFAGIGEVREKNGTKMDQDGNLLLF